MAIMFQFEREQTVIKSYVLAKKVTRKATSDIPVDTLITDQQW